MNEVNKRIYVNLKNEPAKRASLDLSHFFLTLSVCIYFFIMLSRSGLIVLMKEKERDILISTGLDLFYNFISYSKIYKFHHGRSSSEIEMGKQTRFGRKMIVSATRKWITLSLSSSYTISHSMPKLKTRLANPR